MSLKSGTPSSLQGLGGDRKASQTAHEHWCFYLLLTDLRRSSPLCGGAAGRGVWNNLEGLWIGQDLWLHVTGPSPKAHQQKQTSTRPVSCKQPRVCLSVWSDVKNLPDARKRNRCCL